MTILTVACAKIHVIVVFYIIHMYTMYMCMTLYILFICHALIDLFISLWAGVCYWTLNIDEVDRNLMANVYCRQANLIFQIVSHNDMLNDVEHY